jgi:hypothetical protein
MERQLAGAGGMQRVVQTNRVNGIGYLTNNYCLIPSGKEGETNGIRKTSAHEARWVPEGTKRFEGKESQAGLSGI